MKAFYLVKNGKADSAFELRDYNLPAPEDEQVLIKTEAFGLNYADVMARLGLYRDCPPLPTVIGYEAVGHVEAVGKNVTTVKPGDRVLTFTRFGAYASHILSPEIAVVPINEDLPTGKAVALATQYSTAWYAFEECKKLHKGDRILIHAAAGGVGTALVQLAKRRGCIIAGTASPHKHEYLKQQGVDLCIDYRNQDFEKVLKKEGWAGKLDAVFDPVGGISVRKGVNLLNSGGSMIMYGGSSMTDSKSPLHKLKVAAGFGLWSPIVLLMRSISLIGVNMLHIGDDKPELLQHCMQQVVELSQKGELNPTVGGEFKASELAKAHEYLESRQSIGKLVVHWED
ncbi:MAG: zinc-binding dehydrogenase [Chitinophagales bacterium]